MSAGLSHRIRIALLLIASAKIIVGGSGRSTSETSTRELLASPNKFVSNINNHVCIYIQGHSHQKIQGVGEFEGFPLILGIVLGIILGISITGMDSFWDKTWKKP